MTNKFIKYTQVYFILCKLVTTLLKMSITTIKLEEETKQRLEKLREFKKESYDEILKKILSVLNIVRVDPERARAILSRVEETKEMIKARELEEKEEKTKI